MTYHEFYVFAPLVLELTIITNLHNLFSIDFNFLLGKDCADW